MFSCEFGFRPQDILSLAMDSGSLIQDYMIVQVSSSMECFNMFIVIQLIQRWCVVTHHLLLMVMWEDSLVQD